MKILLSKPQLDFVSAKDQFPAFVGGFGSGKSHAAIMRAIALKLQYPKQNVAYYLPTYDLVRTIGFPRFSEVLDSIGLPFKINKSDAVIEFGGFGSLIFRTMDTPERIIGYEVADSLVDELDTLPTEKAREVWNKIISRNRQKKPDGTLNTVGVVTTPEGFRFVYERWHKNVAEGYRLIKAKTASNAKHLPDGYIKSLEAIYPTNLLQAYLGGEFVNLTAGSVYPEFDRVLNVTKEIAISTEKDKEPLHIGLDFNVGKMSAVVHVLRNDEPHAVNELTGVFDTPAMIQLIKNRYEGHKVYIYPDASGNSRKSNNASQSDIALLTQAKFMVMVNPANPAVKDRVLSMNKMIGERKYRVNPDLCPELVESLERQAYDKNGEPDKSSGFDHVLDATGYCIAYRYPIVRNTMQRIKTIG
jgi:PBSX family phage terminase large subunit